MLVDRDVQVAMQDGVRVKADVFRPEGSGQFPALYDARPPEGRRPAARSNASRLVFTARETRPPMRLSAGLAAASPSPGAGLTTACRTSAVAAQSAATTASRRSTWETAPSNAASGRPAVRPLAPADSSSR
jgi:hypothetical protein